MDECPGYACRERPGDAGQPVLLLPSRGQHEDGGDQRGRKRGCPDGG